MPRFVAVFALLFVMGCASGPEQTAPGTPGSPPVIDKVWAQDALRQNQVWRIYLSASDPDCDLKEIHVYVTQLGQAGYPLQQFMLGGDDRCGVKGQLYMPTGFAYLYGSVVQARVTLVDSAGNTSQPAVLPLTINGAVEQEPPPEFSGPGFKRGLGHINVKLRSPIFDGYGPGIGRRGGGR